MSDFYLWCKQLHPNAKLPRRAKGSAGYDVFPLFPGTIFAGQAVEIPLGFAAEFPANYVAICDDKSGVGFKLVQHLAGVIDANYRGEWKVKMINLGTLPFGFTPEKSIAQFLFYETPPDTSPVEWRDSLSETERGTGMQGSTGH